MEIQYFSWLRKHAGTEKESIEVPAEIDTPERLVTWLSQREFRYRALFSYMSVINLSVNGCLVEDWKSYSIRSSDTLSFFSPMAGG